MADKQLAKKGKSGVDNTFRRTWDKESYSERAAKREKEVRSCTKGHCLLSDGQFLTLCLLNRRRMLKRVL